MEQGKVRGRRMSNSITYVLSVLALLAMQAGAQSIATRDLNRVQEHAPALPARTTGPQSRSLSEGAVIQSSNVKESFHLRGLNNIVIKQVLDAYNVSAVVDERLRPAEIHFDTDEVDYSSAAALLRLATNSMFVSLDAHRVLILPDTQENRAQQQHQTEQTLYLPGLSTQELTDVVNFARLLFDVRAASAQPTQGTVTLIGPSSRLQVLDATIAETWPGKAQIAVDLRLSEVQRSVTRDIGLKLPQSSTAFNVDSEVSSLITSNSAAVSTIVSSGLASADDTLAIAAILIEEGYGSGILTDPFAVFGNGLTLTGVTFGTLTAELSLSSTDSRSLKHSNTVVTEGETAQLKVGSRYPVELSQYKVTNYSTSGQTSSTSTTPQIQYEDLGFTAKITPVLQEKNRIKMKIDVDVQGLAGNTINGLPVLTSRKMTTEFSVIDGGSAMVTSLLDRQETHALTGLPYLGTATAAEGDHDATEIVLSVTPHLVYKGRYESQSPVRLFSPHE